MLAPCKLEQNSKILGQNTISGHPIIKQETIEPSPPLVPKGLALLQLRILLSIWDYTIPLA